MKQKNLENIVGERLSFMRRIANSRAGRFFAGVCLAAMVYTSCGGSSDTPEEETEYNDSSSQPAPPCSDYWMEVSNLLYSPSPTRGAAEVDVSAVIRSNSSPFASAWLDVGGIDSTPLEPADGAFDSNNEEVRGIIPASDYQDEFYTVRFMTKNVDGCSNYTSHSFKLAIFGDNVLFPPDWNIDRIMLRGKPPFEANPDSFYLDFSWEGAGAWLEYDFLGGPVNFNIEAATAIRGNPTEKAHMDVYVQDIATGAVTYIGGADPEQGGIAEYPYYNGVWYNYTLTSDLLPGPKWVSMIYRGDTWDIDLYVRIFEIVEQQP